MSLGSSSPLSQTRGVSLGLAMWFIAVLAPLILPEKACTLVYLALGAAALQKRGLIGKRVLFPVLVPLLWIALLGFVRDYSAATPRFVLQDVWRALKPLAIMYVGFAAISMSVERTTFRAVAVASGAIYGLVYLALLVFNSVTRGVMPLELADVLVYGHFPEALALGLSLRNRHLLDHRSARMRQLRHLAILIALTALLLSGSRTWIMATGIMVLAGSGWMRSRGRWRAVLLGGPALALFLFTPFGQVLFSKGFDVALLELSPASYTEMSDINANWRGYEAFQGLSAYSEGTLVQKAMGQGFGAQADIGLYMNLGGTDFHQIGQFHNGYVWLLLKTGWIGLFAFGLWMWRLIGSARKLKSAHLIPDADILVGVIVTAGFTMIVVSGIYNTISNDALLLAMGGLLVPLRAGGSEVERQPKERR